METGAAGVLRWRTAHATAAGEATSLLHECGRRCGPIDKDAGLQKRDLQTRSTTRGVARLRRLPHGSVFAESGHGVTSDPHVLTAEVAGGAIEYELVLGKDPGRPPLVFLHEGLGSVSQWRDFPRALAEACGSPTTLVYSRHGYGRSAEVYGVRPPTFLHREADIVLPELLDRLGIERPILVGHSDGASIALLYAGGGRPARALVLIAPHVFVEPESLDGIRAVRQAYESGLREALRRHHRDVDAMFWSWSDAWLSAEFARWNIEDRLPAIEVPILLVQGQLDQYGTLAQLDAIEQQVRGPVCRLVLNGIGHTPHVEAADRTLHAAAEFITGIITSRRDVAL